MKRTKTSPAVDQLETVFKALADKTRLRILSLLGNNEVCVCHIHDSLGLPQPWRAGLRMILNGGRCPGAVACAGSRARDHQELIRTAGLNPP